MGKHEYHGEKNRRSEFNHSGNRFRESASMLCVGEGKTGADRVERSKWRGQQQRQNPIESRAKQELPFLSTITLNNRSRVPGEK